MEAYRIYADSDHPAIRKLAARLTRGCKSEPECFEKLFDFVQNSIPFGFPPVWDQVHASETLEYGVGYCTTKSILLHALCKSAGIQVRLHIGMIQTGVMKHIFPLWAFPFFPETMPHFWLDAIIDNHWYSTDAYILDRQLLAGAIDSLHRTNSDIGYGIASLEPGCDGRWNDGFVQTNAVVEDLGYWDDAGEFYEDPIYEPPTSWQMAFYPVLRRLSNSNIDALRNQGAAILGKQLLAPQASPMHRAYAVT